MGLIGCRLWVMCQLDSNVQSPTAFTASRWLGLGAMLSSIITGGAFSAAPSEGSSWTVVRVPRCSAVG
jgi:hypothetical protein